MKIAIPVAAYHLGNPAQYIQRALVTLGHEAEIVSQWGFYDAIKANAYDLYFCVDSGGALNLFESSIADCSFRNLCFWMIDYRRGKWAKNPNDIDTCRLIGQKGGWVFQSQFEDVGACAREATDKVSWLPLAADPDIWTSDPNRTEFPYEVGFIGNTWDNTRLSVLQNLRARFKLSPTGDGQIWNEAAATLLQQSKIAFNISSFYGDASADFDINMRVWEELATAKPIVTNMVSSLMTVFGAPLPRFIRTYSRLEQVVPTISQALSDAEFLGSGKEAREWILQNGTYLHRMKTVLESVRSQGMVH